MQLNSDHSNLFKRLLEGKLSPDELEELVKWLGDENLDQKAAELIDRQLKQPVENADQVIVNNLEKRLPAILGIPKKRYRSFNGNRLLRYAAVFIVISSLVVLYLLRSPAEVKEPQIVQVKTPVLKNDIAPGKSGAVLTLADGNTVVLDNLENGIIATQNGSEVLLQNGELKYNANGSGVNAIAYNTIKTPNGRQFQMTLPDGTRVWLNAGSSLRFPTIFTGDERKAELTGEGYFEVVKNPAKPFRIGVNNETEIEVLGTHFNINSYSNETSIKTTLLEGSVKVKTQLAGQRSEVVIAPGQQARLSAGKFKVADNIDLARIIAWKNGVFDFHNATLEEVMRQLERWYDIEVVYEKGIPQMEFVGKMGKDLTLTQVLRGLEMSEVHFRLEGRRLVVML